MNSRILHLAVPSILANITVPLVGMVDIGVSGRLGNVAAIGAIAVGSMLFDLLYWNFGFLRVGTGGLTAQAYGRKDLPSASAREASRPRPTAARTFPEQCATSSRERRPPCSRPHS